ncbi:hypothetical protein B6D60_06675 [candidate division KSB1 bacterium 4484_87]|nr:MAG: hypothetical protein B6D60_06675 [candidate division KSB1 bacterium 4484_87]
MKRAIKLRIAFLFILFLNSFLLSKDKSIFEQRRQNILNSMPRNSLLILASTPECYRFGFSFHQDSDLFYLTGELRDGVALILSSSPIELVNSALAAKSFLVFTHHPQEGNNNEYNQPLTNKDNGEVAISLRKFRKILNKIDKLDVLFTNLKSKKKKFSSIFWGNRLNKLVGQFPDVKIKAAEELTTPFRRVKSQDEIELMQNAIDVTIEAQKEAMRSMKPGVFEHQIEAVIEFVFKYNGCEHLAFPSIVGAGPNSLNLHYNEGERKIASGDMVVIDVGCEYQHYCADITRTIPASGKFTSAQKKVYNAVLEANKAVIDALKPGMTFADMDEIVKTVFLKYGFEKFIRHSCSHRLGLDVHDVGSRNAPFKPGCVVTVEPGIYIPENSDLPKEYWDIGVRIEDDVLITENGHQLLSEKLTKTIEGIEQLMAETGMIDKIQK